MQNIREFKYGEKEQLTKYINSNEVKCKCNDNHDFKIDLVNLQNIQKLMEQNNWDRIYITSGFRCKKHDIAVGGTGKGQHMLGTAIDCKFYKNGKIVPAQEVCCKAQDFGFKGIAYITKNEVHLDNRASGQYRGDETKGNTNNVGGDFYKYFNIKKETSESNPVKVTFRLKTQKKGWLEENVKEYKNEPIIGVAIKVDKGKIKYRVHVKNKNWLPYVQNYDIDDYVNGYAGNDKEIDAIEVYYYTPDDIRPFKKAKYKINNYPYQYDNEKTKGQDGYAGKFGVTVTKFEIEIE